MELEIIPNFAAIEVNDCLSAVISSETSSKWINLICTYNCYHVYENIEYVSEKKDLSIHMYVALFFLIIPRREWCPLRGREP